MGELTDCLALPEGPSSTRPPWDGGTAACHLGSHMSCLDPFITPKISEGDARAVLPSASSQTVGRELHQYPGDRVLNRQATGRFFVALFFFLNKKLNFKKYFSRMITIKLWSPLLPLESKRVKEEKKKEISLFWFLIYELGFGTVPLACTQRSPEEIILNLCFIYCRNAVEDVDLHGKLQEKLLSLSKSGRAVHLWEKTAVCTFRYSKQCHQLCSIWSGSQEAQSLIWNPLQVMYFNYLDY